MNKFYIIPFIYLIATVSFGQCIQLDIAVNRPCVDGQGTITILQNDPDSVTYSIDGGATFVNTPNFTNLNVGTYNIVVQDTTGCVVTTTATIEDFLEVGTLNVTTSCATPSGIIDIRGHLGKPIYQYSYDGGQSFYAADSIKTELAAGTYNVVIKDSYGCEVDTMVTVDAFPAISPTITPQNEQCNGSGPGAVDVTFTDGNTYDFVLNNGASVSGTSYNNANLTAGYYVLDITDVNNCTSSFQFQVGADLVDDSVTINHEYCHYGDGSIEVFGFLGVAPYEYSMDGGTTYSATNVFTNLSQGNKIVFIKDATGCVKEDTIFVSNFGGVVATPSLDDTVCYGNDAIVSVSHNGGVNSNYNWSNGLSNQQSHVVTPTTTTTYTVIVTDSYGCKDTAETTIYVETNPVVTLSENQVHACLQDEVQITASGADSYSWSTGANTATLVYTAIGNETITVTGYNGQCSDTEQIVIVIKPSPTAHAQANTTSINTGDSIFFKSIGTIASTTTWEFGDGFTSMESNPYHRFDFAGAYQVKLIAEMGGCEDLDSILVYVGFVNVDEVKEDYKVILFPNPAKEDIHIQVNQPSTLQLIDLSGKLLYSKILQEGDNQIDLNNLAKGVYICVVQNEKRRKLFKLYVEN